MLATLLRDASEDGVGITLESNNPRPHMSHEGQLRFYLDIGTAAVCAHLLFVRSVCLKFPEPLSPNN